ncbi:MAG: hypothetical protein IPM46_06765 [Flavobacteriales bacterium]|nr:hypothetical protein [Flavobacteriales bacterium]
MNTQALTLMLATQLTVIAITAYFFYRVFTTPPRKEPDSFAENDDEPR